MGVGQGWKGGGAEGVGRGVTGRGGGGLIIKINEFFSVVVVVVGEGVCGCRWPRRGAHTLIVMLGE